MDEAKSNKKCLSDHTDSDDLIARKIRAATVFSRNFATQFFLLHTSESRRYILDIYMWLKTLCFEVSMLQKNI
jgi:hypothetical protein